MVGATAVHNNCCMLLACGTPAAQAAALQWLGRPRGAQTCRLEPHTIMQIHKCIMLTCFIPAINLAGKRQPEVSCLALPFLSALERVESNETKTPIKMHYLAQNCQRFIPHVAACRATRSPRVSLLRACCSAQKKSQQSSFSSQSIQCNSSIIPVLKVEGAHGL